MGLQREPILIAVAPEVIGKQSYSVSPDWWSLGVVMYEMLFTEVHAALPQPLSIFQRPFRGTNSTMLAGAIASGDMHIPSNLSTRKISEKAISVLKGVCLTFALLIVIASDQRCDETSGKQSSFVRGLEIRALICGYRLGEDGEETGGATISTGKLNFQFPLNVT